MSYRPILDAVSTEWAPQVAIGYDPDHRVVVIELNIDGVKPRPFYVTCQPEQARELANRLLEFAVKAEMVPQ